MSSGNPRIERILSEVRGPDVLDLGCGGRLQGVAPAIGDPTWLHGHIRQRHPNAWGLELSSMKVAHMRAAGFSNVHQGDAEEFSLDARFDTIVSGDMIEHLAEPGRMLRAARAHLKPGGRLVVTTGWPFGLPSIAYAWLKHPKTCSNPEHTTWFCVSTLARLAEVSGLRMQSWFLVTSVDPGAGRLHSVARPLYRVSARLLPLRLRATTLGAVLVPAT